MTLTAPETIARRDDLAMLCRQARPVLAALGDAGTPLLGVLDAVETAGATDDGDPLASPGFALDVLAQTGPGTDPTLVGRVLDFLRARADSAPASPDLGGSAHRTVTVADAVQSYRAGALALMASGTQKSYATWARRLVEAHGSDDPDSITAGDLKDLIARWVIVARDNPKARRGGNSLETNGVAAYRHLWGYLVDKRWASSNIAESLRKPASDDPLRRPFRREESAVVRHLARGLGRDPMLNEVTITISERLGLRRIELRRLRICDVKVARAEMRVHGKNNQYRDMPVPPVLLELLVRYIESRRPAHISADDWARSDHTDREANFVLGHAQHEPTGSLRTVEVVDQ